MKEDAIVMIVIVIVAIISILFILFTFNKCLKEVTDVPQVYWSTSQNKCVKVVDKGVERDCFEIPEIYHKIWVK